MDMFQREGKDKAEERNGERVERRARRKRGESQSRLLEDATMALACGAWDCHSVIMTGLARSDVPLHYGNRIREPRRYVEPERQDGVEPQNNQTQAKGSS